jgi:hypothetical protein
MDTTKKAKYPRRVPQRLKPRKVVLKGFTNLPITQVEVEVFATLLDDDAEKNGAIPSAKSP